MLREHQYWSFHTLKPKPGHKAVTKFYIFHIFSTFTASTLSTCLLVSLSAFVGFLLLPGIFALVEGKDFFFPPAVGLIKDLKFS